MIAFAAIADAITTELGTLVASSDYQTAVSGGNAANFTASRAYIHEFDLKTAPAFKATVAPGTKATESESRGMDRTDFEVLVTLSKRVTAIDNATIDPLLKSAERVQAYFDDDHPLTGLTSVYCRGARFDGGGIGEVFDEGVLDSENFFWSQLTLDISGWE